MIELEKTFQSLIESMKKQQENIVKKAQEKQEIQNRLEEIERQLEIIDALHNQLLVEKSQCKDQLKDLD